jgi:hypothetical protein
MPDVPPNPTPTPPTPTPSRRTRSSINQKDAQELDLAESLVATAAKPDYAARLADEGIDAPFLAGLTAKIAEADGLLGSATGKTAGKRTTTQHEEDLKQALLGQIQTVQKRAKRKYPKTGDPQRENYFIGQRVESNRPLLERATRTILQTLATDALPGQKPADTQALQDALDAYVAVQIAQTAGQSGATTDRALLEAKVKEVAGLRRQIQYAVDTLWPATSKANAGLRREFQIPASKALK